MANRVDLSAAKALSLYDQRWGIESSFRDINDYKFGMGIGQVRVKNPAQRDQLFLFSVLVILLLTLLGKAGDSVGLERSDQGQYPQKPNVFISPTGDYLLSTAAQNERSLRDVVDGEVYLLPEATSVIYPHTWNYLSL